MIQLFTGIHENRTSGSSKDITYSDYIEIVTQIQATQQALNDGNVDVQAALQAYDIFVVEGKLGVGVSPDEVLHLKADRCKFYMDGTDPVESDPGFQWYIRGIQVGAFFFDDSINDRFVIRCGTAADTNDIIIEPSSIAGPNTRIYINAVGGIAYNTILFGANAERTYSFGTSVAPTTNVSAVVQMYFVEVAAGNLAPHFMTSNGQIVKLFTGAALTTADAGTVNSGDATTDGVINNIRTRLNELEARMQANGLIL